MPGPQAISPEAHKKTFNCVQDCDPVCIDSIRCLAAALPQSANSGHPGAPMGCAPMAHSLYSYIMNYSPSKPNWWNRDRFVLSNGHGCALLYTMLHLCGYDKMTIDDLKNFRQLNSRTPGHPESHTAGIEVTTGPLGQGLAQAVGLSLATHHLAAKYNKSDCPALFDNYTYVICGDGCLQEGVTSEASSLAGHLKLGRLIVLYDSNKISIDGDTSVTFTEDVLKRYEAYGWHVDTVEKGDTDVRGLVECVKKAKGVTDKPSLILVKTTIGYGSAKQGTAKTHGAPLGVDDLKQCREKFGLPKPDDLWHVDEEVIKYYAEKKSEGDSKCKQWEDSVWKVYQNKYPKEAAELTRRFNMELPSGWEAKLCCPVESKAAATRALSHAALNNVATFLPELIGGSADLTESNKTDIKGAVDCQPTSYDGTYIRFGVREHAMCSVTNGIFSYGGFRPFAATFLNFIGYAWGACRLSALSGLGVLYIATHDSIELGEDGPTHQPIELLPLLRATPNVLAIRPCDAKETNATYAIWLKNTHRPTVGVFCRSNCNAVPGTCEKKTEKGAYILTDFDKNKMSDGSCKKVILASSGSEVYICHAAKEVLEKNPKITVRLVSMPCWELFEEQPEGYKNEVLPKPDANTALLYCEASSTYGWCKYFNLCVGMTSFGASAPRDALLKHFGFTAENIANTVTKHFNL